MWKYDKAILFIMDKIYDLSSEDREKFNNILNNMEDDKKKEMAHLLRKKMKDEESIFKRLFRNLRNLKVKEKDEKEAEELLKLI